jgi:septum formation inhibitor MinC
MSDETQPSSAEEAAAEALAKAEQQQQEAATAAAEKQAKEIAKSAKENTPEPEAEPEPEEEPDPKDTFVVYKPIRNQPYPGQYLTVTIVVDDVEDSLVLEDGIPTPVTKKEAKAATSLVSPNYTIQSA